MYRQILVPLDGSPLAEQALPYARLFARVESAPVHLLACLPKHGPRNDARELHRLAHTYLEQTAAELARDGLEVQITVTDGAAASEIANAADALADTLLVMSTHGRSGLRRMTLGSVTDRVLRLVASPMLVVRPQGEEPAKDARIASALIALDESRFAEAALPHAQHLAAALGLETLLLLEVLDAQTEYYLHSEAFAGAARDLAEAIEGQGEEYLATVAESLRKAGTRGVATRIIHGTPAPAIVDALEQLADGIVIMTSHGRSGFGRWILGSVAERVVRESSRPVLIVRPGAAPEG